MDEIDVLLADCGVVLGSRTHAKAKALIAAHTQRARIEAATKHEGIGKYLATSMLSMHVGYLLAHRADGVLPEMTAQVVGELWQQIGKIQDENAKYMRATHPDTQNSQDNRVSENDLHNNSVAPPDKGGSE